MSGPLSERRLVIHRSLEDQAGDPADVHAWLLDLDALARQGHGQGAVLSDDERQRAARLRWRGPRTRFIAGRSVVRHLLAARLGRGPEQLTFRQNAFGKPALTPEGAPPQAAPLYFNVAHSEQALLVGLAPVEIGVDVEVLRAAADVMTLAATHFSPADCQALQALPDAARPAAFYRLWTRREASAKAAGLCLAANLSSAAGSPTCGHCRQRPAAPPAADAWPCWSFEAQLGPDTVAAAVVIESAALSAQI